MLSTNCFWTIKYRIISGKMVSSVPARRMDSLSAPPVLTPTEANSLLNRSTNCCKCIGSVVTAPVEYWGSCVVSFQIQIKENRYQGVLSGYHDKILLVGINYDKDTREHECVIEEWNG